ncbi:Propionate kinase [Balamuthia mandrillaris]
MPKELTGRSSRGGEEEFGAWLKCKALKAMEQQQKIVVVNTGSSSLKCKVFEKESLRLCASGHIEDIGKADGKALLSYSLHLSPSSSASSFAAEELKLEEKTKCKLQDHEAALQHINEEVPSTTTASPPPVLRDKGQVWAVGHRVVHGWHYTEPILLTKDSMKVLKQVSELAPLHNAANLMGVELSQKLLSSGDHQMPPQVGVFDTSFHQTLPPQAYSYALPWSVIQQKKLRKYGFHGSSYRYVANKAAQHMERPLEQLRLIVLHLGSGCSVCAIQEGRSVDTSMGFTPLEGLAMATRSGDVDPMVLPLLLEHITEEEAKKKEKEGGKRGKEEEGKGHTVGTEAKHWDKLEELLNKRSGMVGLCGHDDMRDVVRLMKEGTPEERNRASLAFRVFVYRVQKYIGSYYVALGGLDALIFTGGIGENSAPVREAICEGMGCLGIHLDRHKNCNSSNAGRGVVELQREAEKDTNMHPKVLLVKTDEEWQIAHETKELLLSQQPRKPDPPVAVAAAATTTTASPLKKY